jgi:uncharacterized membrane protein YphA (DoxX/SURF4 family)
MSTLLDRLLGTDSNKSAAVVRVILGFLFLSTGLMKLTVPALGDAFAAQLIQARIPFHSFNLWFVPIAETTMGLLLILGLFSRLAGVSAAFMMVVATYVHLVVHDADLFPLQPEAPIIPLVVLPLTAYVVWRGGGAWSLDLRYSR